MIRDPSGMIKDDQVHACVTILCGILAKGGRAPMKDLLDGEGFGLGATKLYCLTNLLRMAYVTASPNSDRYVITLEGKRWLGNVLVAGSSITNKTTDPSPPSSP